MRGRGNWRRLCEAARDDDGRGRGSVGADGSTSVSGLLNFHLKEAKTNMKNVIKQHKAKHYP